MHNRPLATRNWQLATRQRGFTFAEIMFAVVILGIGFIMVAAMFPVAIRQTQSSLEELSGVAEAKRGAAIMRQLGTAISGYSNLVKPNTNQFTLISFNQIFPNLVVDDQYPYQNPSSNPSYKSGGELHTFFSTPYPSPQSRAPYDFVCGDMINPLDARYAWIPVAYQTDIQAVDAGGNRLALDTSGILAIDPTAGSAGNPKANQVNNRDLVPVARVLPETARVWVVAVQKRNPDSAQYTSADRTSMGNNHVEQYNSSIPDGSKPDEVPTQGAFRPKVVYFKLVEGEDPLGFFTYPDTLVFTNVNGIPQDEPCADTGAYVWVASDRLTPADAASYSNVTTGAPYYKLGSANGRFYRLGSKRDDLNNGVGVWELQPGNDMALKRNPGPDAYYNTNDDFFETENLPPHAVESPPSNHPAFTTNYNNVGGSLSNRPARGFMIGKGLKNPTLPWNASTNPYVGTAQDVYALPPVTITLRPKQ